MQSWEEEWFRQKEVAEENGSGKKVHILGFPADAEYINNLHSWSLSATPRAGLVNAGKGKIPPHWGEEMKWLRERTPRIKERSRALGSRRGEVRSLTDLGAEFDYRMWKSEQQGGGSEGFAKDV